VPRRGMREREGMRRAVSLEKVTVFGFSVDGGCSMPTFVFFCFGVSRFSFVLKGGDERVEEGVAALLLPLPVGVVGLSSFFSSEVVRRRLNRDDRVESMVGDWLEV